MVKKVLNILSREFSGLHQAAFLLGTFALFSQILALVRDRMFAHEFGASTTLDIIMQPFVFQIFSLLELRHLFL